MTHSTASLVLNHLPQDRRRSGSVYAANSISVVVPLYNEEGNVKKLHSEIVSVLEAIGKPYEIIFVDDGSSDRTVEECRECSPLVLVTLMNNFGQTAAFDAGIKQAQGDVVVTLDGDLQNDPRDIPKLLEKIEEGYDVVSGWRKSRKDTLSKRITSRSANLLRKILFGDTIHDSGCALKAYRRGCFRGLDLFGEMHRFIPALLSIQGFRVTEVVVNHRPRFAGRTKYGNLARGIKGFVDMLVVWFWGHFHNRPMHLFGGAGFVLAVAGAMFLLWMAFEKVILGADISQRIWPMVGVFLVLTGMQLFTIGFLADLVMKSYYKTQRKMNYVIGNVYVL